MNAVIYACYSSDSHADADFVSTSYNLTIGNSQATIHVHAGETPPSSLVCPDPDSDPSVRESVWTQWTNRCEIPYFLLTERTHCTQNRQKS